MPPSDPLKDSSNIEGASERKNSYTVSSVITALELLMVIGEMPGHGLTEIAKASGTTKGRTFRLLQTLEEADFVSRSGKDAQYWLGPRARLLGELARQNIDLASVFTPILEDAARQCRETVQVRIRQGLESNCICVCEPDRIVRYHGEIGHRMPLHVGSSKLLLAYASRRLQRAALATNLLKLTNSTITNPAQLAERLAQIREEGFCVSRGESDPDAMSVGVPIRDPAGDVIAALIVAAPIARVSDSSLSTLLDVAKATSQRCEGALQQASIQR